MRVDVHYSLQMLACLEMPDVGFKPLPSLLRASSLHDMVRNGREHHRDSGANEFFTADDVKEALHTFAGSSKTASNWLIKLLKLTKKQQDEPEYLREVLDTIVDSFMEVVPSNGMGLSRHSLATLCPLLSLPSSTEV
jgi:hypothetical protein